MAITLAWALAEQVVPGRRHVDTMSDEIGEAMVQLLEQAMEFPEDRPEIDWSLFETA